MNSVRSTVSWVRRKGLSHYFVYITQDELKQGCMLSRRSSDRRKGKGAYSGTRLRRTDLNGLDPQLEPLQFWTLVFKAPRDQIKPRELFEDGPPAC